MTSGNGKCFEGAAYFHVFYKTVISSETFVEHDGGRERTLIASDSIPYVPVLVGGTVLKECCHRKCGYESCGKTHFRIRYIQVDVARADEFRRGSKGLGAECIVEYRLKGEGNFMTTG